MWSHVKHAHACNSLGFWHLRRSESRPIEDFIRPSFIDLCLRELVETFESLIKGFLVVPHDEIARCHESTVASRSSLAEMRSSNICDAPSFEFTFTAFTTCPAVRRKFM